MILISTVLLFYVCNNEYLLINGLGNYCNHSENNNIKPLINTEKPLITFIALHDIQKGDELFNNYGEAYFKYRNIEIIKNNKANQQKMNTSRKIHQPQPRYFTSFKLF